LEDPEYKEPWKDPSGGGGDFKEPEYGDASGGGGDW
jgi:hypothetical protein